MFKAMAVTAGAVTLGTGTRVAGAAPGTEIRVLSINTWLNGTSVSGGLSMVADIVTATRANVVILTESNSSATNSVATRLTNAGTKFYAATASDCGILSQFPISESSSLGWMTKTVITVDGTQIATYAAHLNYKYYATYLPRGYGPGSDSGEFSQYGWNKMPAPVTDVTTVQRVNINSGRPQAITNFINDAALEQAKGRSIILGGDFNEPSHLDWTDAAKTLFDHNGVVIPWESTRRLEQAGFVDAYRSKYPNPVTHPGFTWPSDNPAKSPSQLTWAPAADERDRIDYIFTDSASKLQLTEAGIVGPRSTIVRNQRVTETSQDNFIASPTSWPTDHKAVLAVYQINTATPDAETTTTVAAPDSVKNGAEVILTANIDPAAQGGTVQFLDGTTPLGEPVEVTDGTASITHTFGTDGAHAITAVFSGSPGFLASTSEVKAVNVSTDAIVTTVAMTSPDKAFVDQEVNLHAQVSPAVQGGTVEFTVDDGDKVTGTVGTDGVATAAYKFTTAGTHSVIARYSGTTGTEAAVAPAFQVNVTVAPPTDVQTTTTLDPVGTVEKGAPVTLRAKVDPANANGTVQFKLGDTPLGGPVTVSSGVATLATTFAASGTFSVTAEFIASAGFIGSASAPQTLTVPADPDPGNPGTPGGMGSLENLFGS
ncbi:Endonuclease/Exonuclease/phosphatase family protein [Rhodococcus tukisamuensis]|uniref:Endonuclease/Exonuclease/phosphatase family protein n=2 Tax=Rhodococcus tukisamuensis TaxID=168276 RepID=A0A1G7BGF5_9NOCA|nr:Endonuclease/Exonuclease/phosphatase family protein [Rhodococcus tukisamuensis]